jgi:sugar phosphate isomerase/epimerase
MLRIGLRAHDYGAPAAPEALAERLAAHGAVSAQLALAKALVPPDAGFAPGSLSPGYARRVRDAFAASKVAIAVLGCYINPVHPDGGIRESQLRRFEEHLRFAADFDCRVVGTETGSCNADCSYHPATKSAATRDIFYASIDRLLNCAEKCGAIVAIEPVAHQHTIATIADAAALLAHFQSPALKIIFDPVNLIPISGFAAANNEGFAPSGTDGDTFAGTQAAFFAAAFAAFGESIVAIHAKDFRMAGGVKKGDLPACTGDLDYRALLAIINRRKPGIDILLENNNPAQVGRTIARLGELC